MLDARDHVLVALAHSAGAHVRRVGAAARLGQRERGQPLAAGAARQPLRLLLGAAAKVDRIRAQVMGTDHGRGGRAGARDGHQRHQHGRGRHARAAHGLGQVHAHHAELGQARHMAGGGKRLLVHGLGHGARVSSAKRATASAMAWSSSVLPSLRKFISFARKVKKSDFVSSPSMRRCSRSQGAGFAARLWPRRCGSASSTAAVRCVRPGPAHAGRGW